MSEFFIHESSYCDERATIGLGTKIWHFCHIFPGATIGAGCTIGQNVMIGANVKIGNSCKIQNNVSIYEGVILEDNVFCGPSMVFTNVKTPRAGVDRRREYTLTYVRKGATIGANATIVCGHELGAYCVIAAGAVVTKPVPPHAVMAGVPATQIGWASHAGEMLKSDADGTMTCPRQGDVYEVKGGKLVRV